jgi:hypothetical protein
MNALLRGKSAENPREPTIRERLVDEKLARRGLRSRDAAKIAALADWSSGAPLGEAIMGVIKAHPELKVSRAGGSADAGEGRSEPSREPLDANRGLRDALARRRGLIE